MKKPTTMKKKQVIAQIRKEINNYLNEDSGYDFLGTRSFLREDDVFKVIEDESFQKQLFYDILNNKPNVKLISQEGSIGSDWTGTEYGVLDVECFVDINYQYQNKELPLNFTIVGKNVEYRIKKSISAPTKWAPSFDDSEFSYINWDDFDVYIHYDGNDVLSVVLEKNKNMRVELIKKYVLDLIEKETSFLYMNT